MSEPLMKPVDAAKYLDMPVGTLGSMISKKQIPYVRLAPRIPRFKRSELDAWIAARSVREAR